MVAKMKKDTTQMGEGISNERTEQPSSAEPVVQDNTGKTDQAEDLVMKLQDAEKRAAENYDKYMRALAELDNYRKRAVRDKAEAIQYGTENLLRDILPLVDAMDRAVEHACTSEDFESFKKGLVLLQKQLMGCLQKHGVEVIDTAGKAFDPHVHEAVMQVESEQHEDSHVVGELERGYRLKGKLLRPAKVSVCKRRSTGDQSNNSCEEAQNN
jgi:molecular chaperone GrpE